MADGTLRPLPCLTTPVPTTTNGRSGPGPASVETGGSVNEGRWSVDKFCDCQEGVNPLPPSFQTVCSNAAWPDLETRHQCAEGAACSLVALAFETGARFRSSGLFGIAKRCLFLLPLGEGGPEDRMRGRRSHSWRERQVYPLTPTLSHWERWHIRITLGYHLGRHPALDAGSIPLRVPQATRFRLMGNRMAAMIKSWHDLERGGRWGDKRSWCLPGLAGPRPGSSNLCRLGKEP